MPSLLPAPSSTPPSMSTQADMSAGAGYSGPTALPTLSSVYNVDASAAPYGLPTYEEATAGAHRGVQPSGVNALLHHDLPGRAGLIGQWEAEKWKQVSDAISEFANSSIAAEGNFSAEKVDPALRAIAKWTNMVMQPPPMMKKGILITWSWTGRLLTL